MNKRERKTSAVEYIRVSGLGQVEGDGETRQKETNNTFAKREGYSIDASYFDAGVSGCNDIEGREVLQALFEYIEEKDIRICIVEGADRVARDLMVSECILDRFRKLGCKVVESRSGQDLTNAEDNPTQELVQKILAVVAMFDKKTTVKKLKAARDRKRKSGKKVEGRKAYGEVDATEKEIIALARKLRRKPRAYGKQRSFEAVATELNALGHRNRSGGKWSGQMVRRILR